MNEQVNVRDDINKEMDLQPGITTSAGSELTPLAFFVSEELELSESGSPIIYTLLRFLFLSFFRFSFPNLLSFLSLSSYSSLIFFYLSFAFPEVN